MVTSDHGYYLHVIYRGELKSINLTSEQCTLLSTTTNTTSRLSSLLGLVSLLSPPSETTWKSGFDFFQSQ